MPEKPEVITVANVLKNKLLGRKITDCKVYWDNIIEYPKVSEFVTNIKNQLIKDISTRGKWIVFTLDDFYLLVHLRMEGKFFFRDSNIEKNKHEHVIFSLDDDSELRFHDVRKFGKMHLIEKGKLEDTKPIKDLGLEYNDPFLSSTYLLEKFSKKNLPIKTVLLDQSIITGIGNIYDDEILYLSSINPLKKANKITKEECEDIIKNTKIILEKAIKLGGTTIRSYTSSEGVHGKFQHELLVHNQKACPKKHEVIKIRVGGRGTYYCPICQKDIEKE